MLAGLVADRGWPGPLRGHAVTDSLRAEWPDGDDEQWEYAALMAAADDSRALRGEGDAPRRYVVAADVPDARPVPGDDPTVVEVAAGVTWRAVAAAHVDTEDDLVTEAAARAGTATTTPTWRGSPPRRSPTWSRRRAFRQG